jgi:hypothetical protein
MILFHCLKDFGGGGGDNVAFQKESLNEAS